MEQAIHEKHLLQMKFKEKFAFLYDRHSLFYYVIVLILVGLGFFGFALITQKFTTPYSGDFSQQYFAFEYNFYDDWWTFFKTGQFPFYDSNTFLGADNVISNTYYGLFSPFTFPILFFPRSFVPHAMALMSIAKLVIGALLFRIYLKYMGASETSARIFSIAYAFMGWTAFYLWFNNFGDVVTFLPLILFGIEKIIRQKQIWACSLGYFLMGLGNYFFLLVFGIFGVIYAGFRFFQTFKERGGFKAYKDHLAVIGLGILGFALGYLMVAAVLIPSLIGSFGISRATGAKYLDILKQAFADKDYNKAFEIIFKWWHPNIASYGDKPEDYYFAYTFPLASYFYPTLSCRYVNIVGYSSFENAGSSIFFFTPCIILFGACMYRSFVTKKYSHFIAIALAIFCLFVPFFYFLSGAFTNNYGRWEIVVPTMGLVYIALNYDHRHEIPRLVIIISGILALVGMVLTFFLALKMIEIYGYENPGRTSRYIYSLDHDDQIAVVWYEIILCVIETSLFAGLWKKKCLSFIIRMFIIGEVIVMGTVVANMHYLQSIDYDVNGGLKGLSYRVALINKVNKEDTSFFRMYSSVADESHVNIPEADNYNGLTTFHTFYNNQVDDFVHMTNMMSWDESWSSHYLFKHQYMESFLGVKYYLTRDSDTKYYGLNNIIKPESFATSYIEDGKELFIAGKTVFNKGDCSASSNSIFFDKNGYIQNVDSLELQSISFESDLLSVYGAKDNTSPFVGIPRNNNEYVLNGYHYFKIINDNASNVGISDITIRYNNIYNPNVPLNFSLHMRDEENGYRIYKNDHHINFAMVYDTLYYKHTDPDKPKYNEFYQGNSVYSNLRNEEVLFKGAILNDNDLDEIIQQNPDKFTVVDGAPTLDMKVATMKRGGIYAPYKFNEKGEKEFVYLDPENPLKYVQEQYKVKNFNDESIPTNAYQIVYNPPIGSTFPHDEHGSYFIIDYPIRNPWSNYNTCFWLIDETGKTITFDEVRYTESDNTFVGRALYSTKPVSKIIVCPLGDKVYNAEYMNLYYENYGDVIAKLDKAADNGIKDLTRKVNTYTFNTSYLDKKFVVTQLAYTGGWKVKATDANGNVTYPKVYNAQGGFAGFVAPSGYTEYEITYMTPGFVKWALVSAVAFVGLGVVSFTPIIVRKVKEKRGEPLNSSN